MVSVGLWGDLWCVRFIECYGAIAVYDRIILECVMKWNGDLGCIDVAQGRDRCCEYSNETLGYI